MNISDATSIGIPHVIESIKDESKEYLADVSNIKSGNAVLMPLDERDLQRFLIDSDVSTIGRDASSDIFLNDHSVSRRHAEIVRKNGEFTVADIGSLNGTYVNNDLKEGAISLNNGDVIQIGKFRLAFFKK